jgi:hypothetical protein
VFGRSKPSRTHTQQMWDELMESYGHLKQAAGHVTGGTAERVTPSYDRARDAASRSWNTTMDTLSPLYDQIREGAINARKETQVSKEKKWLMLVGLLAAGTAAGAIGAMVARRRRATAQWDEYEPLPAIDDLGYGTSESPRSTGKNMTAGAASVADSVSNKAGKVADALHEKSGKSRSSSSGS